jgi:hypothetical protein
VAEALSLLARQGPPDGDILFLGAADGEMEGEWGLQWVLEHRPHLAEVGAAIIGGGGSLMAAGEVVVASVLVAGRLDELVLPQALRRALTRLSRDGRLEAPPEASGLAAAGPVEWRLLHQRGVEVCGLLPFPLEEDGPRQIDKGPGGGAEECLSLESFEFGVRLMIEWLREAVYSPLTFSMQHGN